MNKTPRWRLRQWGSPAGVVESLNEMTWSEFFSMGGYAFYVWGSYLVTLIVMGGEVVFLLRRKRSLRVPAPRGSENGGSNKQ